MKYDLYEQTNERLDRAINDLPLERVKETVAAWPKEKQEALYKFMYDLRLVEMTAYEINEADMRSRQSTMTVTKQVLTDMCAEDRQEIYEYMYNSLGLRIYRG